MSTSEIESYKNTFILSSSSTKSYIYNKGYFSKTLLPYNPIEKKRYCEIKCLLSNNTSNSSTICSKIWKVYWRDFSTGNLHKHLQKHHSSIPRSIEEETQNRALDSLEGTLLITT